MSETPTAPPRRMLDVHMVAHMLGCSWRTVLRLADRGVIPQGRKLGSLRRWDVTEVEAFIDGGCKPLRASGRRGKG